MDSVTISIVDPKIKLAFGREILESKKLLSAYSEQITKKLRRLYYLFLPHLGIDTVPTDLRFRPLLALHKCL